MKFTSDIQPKNRKPRGRAERTKIIAAMEREGQTEAGFYDVLVRRAFDPTDNFAYKEVLQRIAPIPKSVMPLVDFELDRDAEPQVKASQILDAISNSNIPPDIGIGLINAIRNVIDIEIGTELRGRIEKLEAMVDGD